jgi:hemolysin III
LASTFSLTRLAVQPVRAKLASWSFVPDSAPLHTSVLPDFPRYTAAERVADRIIHLVGLAAASIAIAWLWSRIGPGATGKQLAAVSVYSFGLVGMLSASGLYNFARPGRLKAVLRCLDHAMIFVMIAGSYTPFALNALSPRVGVPVCVVVWGLAALGIGLRLACPRRHEILSLALYLGMGWLIIGVFPSLLAVLPFEVLLLLLIGGIIYSLGSFVHTHARMPFHNAVWHAMVVAAAGLHLAAVAQLFPNAG